MSTKGFVLELLERSRGHHLSGAEMAAALGVSRNAVWKAVQELREEGYFISAVSNKGYLLGEGNDILSAQGIAPFLASPDAGEILVYDTLPSTNQTAKELAEQGAPHGTAVIADCQTAGRGRFGRRFFSQKGGGLYMSVVLRPQHLTLESPRLLTLFGACCVCEAIETVTGVSTGIKWVNDVLVGEKKVCGILTEAVLDYEAQAPQWFVMGIGVNVHVDSDAFPPDLRASAASLSQFARRPVSRCRLAGDLLGRLLGGAPKREDLLPRYKQRLRTLGRRILAVRPDGASYPARAVDLDAHGRLLVEREDGSILPLASGEIQMLP